MVFYALCAHISDLYAIQRYITRHNFALVNIPSTFPPHTKVEAKEKKPTGKRKCFKERRKKYR